MVGNSGNSHGCSIPACSLFTPSPALRPWGRHRAGTPQGKCQIPQLSGDKHRDYETDPHSLSRSPVIRWGCLRAGLPTAVAGVVARPREEQGRGVKQPQRPAKCRCARSVFNRCFPKSPSQEAFLSLGFCSLLVVVVPRGAPLRAGSRAVGHFWGMLCSESEPICAPQPRSERAGSDPSGAGGEVWLRAGGSCVHPLQLCSQPREGKSTFCARL